MPRPLRFALNRMVAPSLSLVEFLDLALELQIDAIELRNDLPGVEITDGTPPERVRELRRQPWRAGVVDQCAVPLRCLEPGARAATAAQLAEYAALRARGLVLCPLNEAGDPRYATQRAFAAQRPRGNRPRTAPAWPVRLHRAPGL